MITRSQARLALSRGQEYLRTIPLETFQIIAKHLTATEADRLSAVAPDFAYKVNPLYKYYLFRDFNLTVPADCDPKLYYHVVAIRRYLETMFEYHTSRLPTVLTLYAWFQTHDRLDVKIDFLEWWVTTRSITLNLNLKGLEPALQNIKDIYEERLTAANYDGAKSVRKGYFDDADEAYDYSHSEYGKVNITFGVMDQPPLLVIPRISLDLLLFKNMAEYDYRQYDLELR